MLPFKEQRNPSSCLFRYYVFTLGVLFLKEKLLDVFILFIIIMIIVMIRFKISGIFRLEFCP